MKKLLILFTCIIGIGAVSPAQAHDRDRHSARSCRESSYYPAYRTRDYYDDDYRSYPVSYRQHEYSYREVRNDHRSRCETSRPRLPFPFFFLH